jgi:hypothetical protein
MTIHYHGSPIWGDKSRVLKVAATGAGTFVSYARPDQIKKCLEFSDSVAIDNGAFSAWKRGLKLDWTEFYQWLLRYYHNPKLKFFIIPDDIEGGEAENDFLIKSVPAMFRGKAVPVWHMHESMERLIRLAIEFDFIAIGSSGEYATLRTKKWRARMKEAFTVLYENDLNPKIHGLRMLDGRVLGNYPLTSADSTNLACNVPKYKIKYPLIGGEILTRNPFTNEDKNELLVYRCAVLKAAIESVTPPTQQQWINNI